MLSQSKYTLNRKFQTCHCNIQFQYRNQPRTVKSQGVSNDIQNWGDLKWGLNRVGPVRLYIAQNKKILWQIQWRQGRIIEKALKHMYVATWTPDTGWLDGKIVPHGPLSIYPSAQVLCYGQAVYEGVRVMRSEQENVVVFRPERNALRMEEGSARMSMPPLPPSRFLQAVDQVVAANASHVPPAAAGQMYLRPLLFGSGGVLPVEPAQEYTFTMYAAAVGSYFSESGISVLVDEEFHRAAPGGVGAVKAAGNYSQCIIPKQRANELGYDDIMSLDVHNNTYLEELSAANVFVVKGKRVISPRLDEGTLLAGVNRESLLVLARDLGYDAQEGLVSITQAMEADEVFSCGTAAGVTTINKIKYRDQVRQYKGGNPVATALRSALKSAQTDESKDFRGWLRRVKT